MTYTVVIFYTDGRAETAKKKDGSLLVVKESGLDFLTLTYAGGKVSRMVAVCNEIEHSFWVSKVTNNE